MLIEVERLCKSFPAPGKASVEAVRELSFTVAPGEIVGLLGPNGAGKTTTMRILATLEAPTSGNARVASHDVAANPRAVRRTIGLVPQNGGTRPMSNAFDELLLQARLHRLPAAKATVQSMLEMFDLRELADRPTATLSGGQRRRLDLALGLIHHPQVMFLDEPTAALDPPSRAELWRHVRDLRDRRGTGVLISTHHLEEADALCDRVLIMDHGTQVAEDTPEHLKQQLGHDTLTIHTFTQADAGRLAEAIRQLPAVQYVRCNDAQIHVGCRAVDALLAPAVLAAHDHGITVVGMQARQPSLDDAFLALTGHTTTEE